MLLALHMVEHTKFLCDKRFQGFKSDILRVASLLAEKFLSSGPLGQQKFTQNLKRSVYIHVALLKNFPEQFERLLQMLEIIKDDLMLNLTPANSILGKCNS